MSWIDDELLMAKKNEQWKSIIVSRIHYLECLKALKATREELEIANRMLKEDGILSISLEVAIAKIDDLGNNMLTQKEAADLWQEIKEDDIATQLLEDKAKWMRMSFMTALKRFGNPQAWPAYRRIKNESK